MALTPEDISRIANLARLELAPDEAQRMLAWSPSLRCLPLPREVVSPALPLHLAWHRRWQADPVHRWLRERLTDALRPPPITVAGV